MHDFIKKVFVQKHINTIIMCCRNNVAVVIFAVSVVRCMSPGGLPSRFEIEITEKECIMRMYNAYEYIPLIKKNDRLITIDSA